MSPCMLLAAPSLGPCVKGGAREPRVAPPAGPSAGSLGRLGVDFAEEDVFQAVEIGLVRTRFLAQPPGQDPEGADLPRVGAAVTAHEKVELHPEPAPPAATLQAVARDLSGHLPASGH